jgi:hypothetical protein
MGSLRRFFRTLHHALAFESREGRAAEVCAWANALAAVGVGGGAYYGVRSFAVGGAVAFATFIMLRLALAHRLTVWLAAAFGSMAVGASAGALGWLFAHVSEWTLAPPIAGMVVGVAATLAPAWAYSQYARTRANVPDSLLEPRSSHPSMP